MNLLYGHVRIWQPCRYVTTEHKVHQAVWILERLILHLSCFGRFWVDFLMLDNVTLIVLSLSRKYYANVFLIIT